jgi:hypothetical protein
MKHASPTRQAKARKEILIENDKLLAILVRQPSRFPSRRAQSRIDRRQPISAALSHEILGSRQ